MGTIAIDTKQQRLLDAIDSRLDALDQAASPSVSSILTASVHLPAADRIYVHKRLMRLGHPNTEWATSLLHD